MTSKVSKLVTSARHSRAAEVLRRSPVAGSLFTSSIDVMAHMATWPVVGRRIGLLEEVLAPTGDVDFPAREVRRVVSGLAGLGIASWVAGGWGIDALIGAQTRYHGDLDLVVADVVGEEERIKNALAGLGYDFRWKGEAGAWWVPHPLSFCDARGATVEVLSINISVLRAAQRLFSPLGATHDRGLLAMCVSEGIVDGVRTPCLSEPAQILFHEGYRGPEKESLDLNLLRGRPGDFVCPINGERADADRRNTALVVPVFFADQLLRRRWKRHNPEAAVPHITAFWPFPPVGDIDRGKLAQLAEQLRRVETFDFQLASVDWFGRSVAYLAPHPEEPFIALTELVSAVFTHLQPYEGQFEKVVPHLTLGENLPYPQLRRLATLAGRALPVTSRCDQVWLVALNDDGSMDLLTRLPLATSHAGMPTTGSQPGPGL